MLAWGEAEEEGRVFILDFLFGRDELYRCAEQRFEVFWVGKGTAGHHVYKFLSQAGARLAPIDTGRVDWGFAHGEDIPREGMSGAAFQMGYTQCAFPFPWGGETICI